MGASTVDALRRGANDTANKQKSSIAEALPRHDTMPAPRSRQVVEKHMEHGPLGVHGEGGTKRVADKPCPRRVHFGLEIKMLRGPHLAVIYMFSWW